MIWWVPWALIGTTILSLGLLELIRPDLIDWPWPKHEHYQPHWCLTEKANDSGYTAPDGRRSGQPASTSGSTPADAATKGITSATRVVAGSRRFGDPAEGVDPNRVERAAWYDKAEADGSRWAGDVRRGLPLSPEENDAALETFLDGSETDGVLGFFRLGLVYLGLDAFNIAKDAGLYVPYCSDAKFGPYPDTRLAYTYFAYVANECEVPGEPPARAWMDEIKRTYPRPEAEFASWERDAKSSFAGLMRYWQFDPENASDRLKFCLGLRRGGDDPSRCTEASTARQALKLGEAKYAEGDKPAARACWRKAIELGENKDDEDGPDAAVTAQRRLQTMTTTCNWTTESLAAITRDYDARSADLIRVDVIQHSLKSLGHYEGALDGQLSLATRIAIRKYQRERFEDETDILTPLQITNLVCNAAETTRNLVAENTLGVMYTVGLGVEQNIDKAQQWLTDASNRGHADSKYNLALLYGTGVILESYRLCDVPRAPEQADKYLQEAAAQGQKKAVALMKEYGKYSSLGAVERWMLIERQIIDRIRSGPFAANFRTIGKKCVADGINR